jgi:hypothetical protein
MIPPHWKLGQKSWQIGQRQLSSDVEKLYSALEENALKTRKTF